MSNTIQAGPFAGTVVPKHQLAATLDGRLYWPTRARTPLFLVVFPPNQWTVRCTATVHTDMGKGMVEFRAFLVDAQNVERNSASTLTIVASQSDWDNGETIARGRLYDALGLALVTESYDEGDLTETANAAGNATHAVGSAPSTEPAVIAAPALQDASVSVETATQTALPLATAASAASETAANEPPGNRVMGTVNPQLMRVLTSRCEAIGKPVPVCLNDDEVRTQIRQVAALRGAA
jgi:hypothetical protein